MGPLMSPVRPPAVAGQFYPGDREDLDRTVKDMVGHGPTMKAFGVMVPHAGYIYSGRVAGEVYGTVELPRTFVIVGPNHTGLGPAASIMTSGVWQMPDGDVLVDSDLAGKILGQSRLLEENDSAHAYEHSIEVQLPFLQFLVGEPLIVPICLMITSAEQCRDIGVAMAAGIREFPSPVLIIASSDMSHYESQARAQEKDQMALEEIFRLDPEGLIRTVHENHISMCGVAPAAAMLFACKELGASSAKLMKYETSGDVTGDFRQVVGYAGILIG